MSNKVLQNIGSTKITALYLRLSKEDIKSKKEDPSNSILNQHTLLMNYANKNGFKNIMVFVDDGISGVTFKRKSFNKLDELIMDDKISTVIVKDLSRFGRNYIEAGIYLERIFPVKDIRFIAVNDNEDSNHYSEFMPVKNLFNEWYSKDISKKIKSSFKIIDSQGYALGTPPYGYIKRKESKIWVVDEEAAENVRLIYKLRLEGKSTNAISKILESKEILSPSSYKLKKFGVKPKNKKVKKEYFWESTYITIILKNRSYRGDVVNFKTSRKSLILNKMFRTPQKDWSIHENIHEPIVNCDDWEKVQKTFENTKFRSNCSGEVNIFIGFLKCSTCGRNVHKCNDIFRCKQFRLRNGLCDGGTHYIKIEDLKTIVIDGINELIEIAKINTSNDLFECLVDSEYKKIEEINKLKLKELDDSITRNNQIDRIIKKAFEDTENGNLTDERFKKLSSEYEKEQADLETKICKLREAISNKKVDKKNSAEEFVKILKESLKIKELDREILNTFVNKIVVHQPERVNKKSSQKVEIYYRFFGKIDLPKLKKKLPKKIA